MKVIGNSSHGAVRSLPHGLGAVDRAGELFGLHPTALAELSLEPPRRPFHMLEKR